MDVHEIEAAGKGLEAYLNDQETAKAGHRPDPNPNLYREQLCAVVLKPWGTRMEAGFASPTSKEVGHPERIDSQIQPLTAH